MRKFYISLVGEALLCNKHSRKFILHQNHYEMFYHLKYDCVFTYNDQLHRYQIKNAS